MKQFLKEIVEESKFELLIDKNTFSKDVVLKTAYNFLDKGYFFFYTDENGDTIVQFTKKDKTNISPQDVLLEFSDELLSVHLRYHLEQENKAIRETIIGVALTSSIDSKNFIDTIQTQNSQSSQIDFEKDIYAILKEIENDPDLKINNEEIEDILKEIKEESKN